jgi:hypothetical protein
LKLQIKLEEICKIEQHCMNGYGYNCAEKTSILMIPINLNKIERWPDDNLREILDLITWKWRGKKTGNLILTKEEKKLRKTTHLVTFNKTKP